MGIRERNGKEQCFFDTNVPAIALIPLLFITSVLNFYFYCPVHCSFYGPMAAAAGAMGPCTSASSTSSPVHHFSSTASLNGCSLSSVSDHRHSSAIGSSLPVQTFPWMKMNGW
jgi:hypothetical protein